MSYFLGVKNRAVSSLASGVTDVATSWALAAGEGAKFPAAGDFHVTCEDEIAKVTARSTDTLTVVRAQEGTTAVAHDAGRAVELRITAGIVTEIQGKKAIAGWTTDKLLKGAGAGVDPTEVATDTSLITSGRFVLARLPDGTAGYFLKAAGAGVDSAFAALAAADIASGRLALTRLPDGTSGYFLKAGGAGIDPAYALLAAANIPNLDQSKITTGRFPLARLGWTLNKILKGAGASANPTEIDAPAGITELDRMLGGLIYG